MALFVDLNKLPVYWKGFYWRDSGANLTFASEVYVCVADEIEKLLGKLKVTELEFRPPKFGELYLAAFHLPEFQIAAHNFLSPRFVFPRGVPSEFLEEGNLSLPISEPEKLYVNFDRMVAFPEDTYILSALLDEPVTCFHGRYPTVPRQVTTCRVFLKYPGKDPVTHWGAAVLFPGDAYDETKGRKVALKSALRNVSKPERRRVWEIFRRQEAVVGGGDE